MGKAGWTCKPLRSDSLPQLLAFAGSIPGLAPLLNRRNASYCRQSKFDPLRNFGFLKCDSLPSAIAIHPNACEAEGAARVLAVASAFADEFAGLNGGVAVAMHLHVADFLRFDLEFARLQVVEQFLLG
jgi:hypothetical protein